jgi:hypothetical protein
MIGLLGRHAATALGTFLLVSGCAAGDGEPHPTAASRSADPEPVGSTTPTMGDISTSPGPGPLGASVFDDPDSCEDDSVGYRIAFPDAWWWNQPFESEIGPHVQCRSFAPEHFDATTVSRAQPIPEGVAIHVLVIPPGDAGLGIPGAVVTSDEMTVGGQPALVAEYEHEPGGFLDEDERVYRYVIDLGDDRDLVFTTGNTVGDYDENRFVLDGMMASLALFEPGDICGPDGDRFACGQIIVGLHDEAEASIEEVVERNSHGGSPTRISERLDEIRAYVLTVAHGTEGQEISGYLLDEAVEYAELNHAEGEVAVGPDNPVRTTTEEDDIRMTLRLDRDRIAPGGRIWAHVVVENIAEDPVFWGHSSTCVWVASVRAAPEDDRSIPYGRDDWQGIGGTFKDLLVRETDRERSFTPWVDLDPEVQMGCTTDLVISEIAPGGSERHEVAWDGDGPHGMPALPGTYEVTATFTYAGRGTSAASLDADPFAEEIRLDTEVEVVDGGRDYLAPGDAADAALADDRFASALAASRERRWTGSDLWFDGGRWHVVQRLSEPDEELRAIVDALSGEVLTVELVETEGR